MRRTTSRLVGPTTAGLVALLIIACASRVWTAERLLEERGGGDLPIRRGCELVVKRCAVCHEMERVVNADVSSASQWRQYVMSMRAKRGSGILAPEVPLITRCLVYRSLGEKGVAKLEQLPAP